MTGQAEAIWSGDGAGRVDGCDLGDRGKSTAEASFTAFYHRELRPMVRTAALLVGSRALGEEIVHEAFVAVWSRWATLDDPGPYLNRCVLNGVRAQGRRELRQVRLLGRLGQRYSEPAAEIDILTDVLAQLPFPQRAALVLRYYGGLSEADIARALDCPVGSVGPWVHRGLAQMRKALS